MDFDRAKSLVELNRLRYGSRDWDFASPFAGYALRHVPVRDLSLANLSTLLRQGIGADFLMLVVIERLEQNPLVRATHTEGDLLTVALRADALVWKRNPAYRERIAKVWKKIAPRLAAANNPAHHTLFSDYRWFLKAGSFLPA